MKNKLTKKQTLAIASMLFGMFFGAGNLIYPIVVGQNAGGAYGMSAIGFILSAVGIPILAVAAIGMTRSEGVFDLSCKVGRGYGYFFTCALYLTIGPLFAIPRCAAVPFSVGVESLVGEESKTLALAIYSAVFFIIALIFALKPGKILTTIGKVLTPLFIVTLAVLVIAAVAAPAVNPLDVATSEAYQNSALLSGFFKGYDTLDALAGLAFGIIVINVIRSYDVKEPSAVAKSTVKSGVVSGVMMTVIYLAVIIVGAMSMGITGGELSPDGGAAFAAVAQYYFGTAGMIILALIFCLACLKTAIALITSCSETFVSIFPNGPKYKVWAVIFTVGSFLIANLGLSTIISYTAPLLYFLYPLAIVLIILALLYKFTKGRRSIWVSVISFTLIASVFDFVNIFNAMLPEVASKINAESIIETANKYLPLFSYSLGWIVPALLGAIVGIIADLIIKSKAKKTV